MISKFVLDILIPYWTLFEVDNKFYNEFIQSKAKNNLSFTDGYVLSNRLHEHMEWKAANYYDPKNSRYLICFIDNLNMAKVDCY